MPVFGVPGERIGFTLASGPLGAPPLVLFHGFTASRASFSANIPTLRRHFDVLTVDLLGHGESDAPADPGLYSPEAAVARVAALLDHLGFERVLLCGHSLGGALAIRFALDHPERLSGLIVLNSSSGFGTPEWRDRVAPGLGATADRIRREGHAFLRDTALYPAASSRLPEDARRQLAADFERLDPAGVAGTSEGLTIQVNCWERLGQLAVPTLIVLGDRDRPVMNLAPGFLARLPAPLVTVLTIPGAGHAANLERPDLFDPAVVAFASGLQWSEGLDDPAAAPGESGGSRLGRSALTAIGALLLVGGVALMVAAFLAGGTSDAPAAPAASSTPRPAAAHAAAASPTPSATPLAEPTRAAPTATVPPASVGTQAPGGPAVLVATATATATASPSATASPTPAPSPTPTPTPSGPYAAIAGPVSGQPGAVLTFTDASQPAASVLARDWGYAGGDRVPGSGANPAVLQVSFADPGCYTVTLLAHFSGGTGTLAAARSVSIGGGACAQP